MASADLSITKTASVSSATSGQQFTYTMVVKNNGPDTATGVYLIDPIPGNACLNAIATSPQAGSYTYSGNTIKWSTGSLNAGSSVTLNATVTAQAAGTLVNTSTVSGNEPDPDLRGWRGRAGGLEEREREKGREGRGGWRWPRRGLVGGG